MDSQPTANFVAGQLVACGGDSCDRYEDGSWRHMVYTISRRRQHSSAQSENRILLIGGFDDSSRSTTEWISLKVGVFVMTFLNIDNMIECWSARNLRNRFTMVTESKKQKDTSLFMNVLTLPQTSIYWEVRPRTSRFVWEGGNSLPCKSLQL